MQKTKLNRYSKLLFAILFFILPITAFKPATDLVLPNEPLNFKPANYFITEVTDNRPDRSVTAQLLVKDASGKLVQQVCNLQGGVSGAVTRFLDNNLAKNRSLPPVIINIKSFAVLETELPTGNVDGRVKLNFDFGLRKEYGFQHLVNYQGGVHYIRSVNAAGVPEQQIRNSIKKAVTYFNDWMIANANVNLKLAGKVKIKVSDYNDNIENDTIYYNPKRLLTWADFQATSQPGGRWSAMIMPGIDYSQQAEVKDGTVYVNIVLKTYLPKSVCWVKPGAQTDYGLNHEQRHFDVARIVTNRFKQKLLSESLTADTFEAFINMSYLDAYRELDAMQKAYDAETAHGMNTSAQAQWNEKIESELRPKI